MSWVQSMGARARAAGRRPAVRAAAAAAASALVWYGSSWGVTDALLSLISLAERQDPTLEDRIQELRQRHVGIARELLTDDLYDGCPDGIKCDEHGNVWVSAPFGVWVYSPAGERLGTLASPEFITNLTWGGADGRDLFCCGFQTLFRLRTSVRGSGIPARRR